MQSHPPRSIVLAALSVFLTATVASLPACSDESATPTPGEQVDFSTGADAYTVRGIVETLPDPGPPPADLRIRHEHIPGFIGKTGEIHVNRDGVPGMKAMSMEFPLIEASVPLDGIRPGDKVEFTFRVKWLEPDAGGDRYPKWQVTAIERLPDDTEISFENKTPPAGP